jgi:hypothetical protein
VTTTQTILPPADLSSPLPSPTAAVPAALAEQMREAKDA